MYIVDKQIKQMCSQNQLIVENYNADNVGSISYDLRVESIIAPNENGENTEHTSLELYPQQTVFVSTMEVIHIPERFIGVVTEKNSVMRQGLMTAAPYYQPGHKTKCFIRVTNISSEIITIHKGKEIAQILFDELSDKPDVTYDRDTTASFNNEMVYKGFGNYESEYKKELKKIQKAEENLDEKANSIYANVLTFMSIIAAIFSLLTINFEAYRDQEFSKLNILSLNLSMAFIISVLMGLILFFINKKKSFWFYLGYAVFVIALLATNIVLCCIK